MKLFVILRLVNIFMGLFSLLVAGKHFNIWLEHGGPEFYFVSVNVRGIFPWEYFILCFFKF